MSPIFINGMGIISPQQSPERQTPLSDTVIGYQGQKLSCIEPAYEAFIDPKNLRRMSRILKMGTAASTKALKDAGISSPDAIITGTGFGCLEDTGNFISKIIVHREEALTPTPFIQSTHNTIGSLIALLHQCQGYNQTYTQESLSFESCLLDAILMSAENPDQNILAGGADEITAIQHQIFSRFGVLRDGNSLTLIDSPGSGTMQGEGAAYFVLSGRKQHGSYASIDFISTATSPAAVDEWFSSALRQASLTARDIDLVLVGNNGIQEHDDALEKLLHRTLPSVNAGYFKHLCGEYPTAAAFAVGWAARMISDKKIPLSVMAKKNNTQPKNILILNSGIGNCHSLIFLREC